MNSQLTPTEERAYEKKLSKALLDANAETEKIYPTKVNHKGQKLETLRIQGYYVLAFTPDHARNIIEQTKIDLK